MELNVLDNELQNLINSSDKPILIRFHAPWCQPCKAMEPIVTQVAQQFHGRLLVANINVDDNPVMPLKFGVRSLPTFILIDDGQVLAAKIGAPKSLGSWVTEHMPQY